MKRSDRRVLAASTVGALVFGSAASVWIARGSADPAEEFAGRAFLGTALVMDGEGRKLTEAQTPFVGFDLSGSRILVDYACHNFASDYRVENGRLVLFDGRIGSDVENRAVNCFHGAALAASRRLNNFTLAAPSIELTGSELVLRGSGVELTLVDRDSRRR